MAGCFGNNFIDRQLENELFRHLDSENSYYCDNCDELYHEDDLEWKNDIPICPNCESKINI